MTDNEKKLEKLIKEDFFMLSRPMIRLFNLETSVFLCELFSEYKYWRDHNKLTNSDYFYSTVENVQYHTGLSKYQQSRACDVLEQYGLLHKYVHGLPAKRYFRFETAGIEKLKRDIEIEKKKEKEEICENLDKNYVF